MIADRRSPHLVHGVSQSTLRAALYMRVSTGRQAEHDLSTRSSRRSLLCIRSAAWVPVADFVEQIADSSGHPLLDVRHFKLSAGPSKVAESLRVQVLSFLA